MKLSRIPGTETTVKHSFAFKQSTSNLLQQYQALYMQTQGVEVSLKDVVEQMLLDFMAEDKAFQRALKQAQAAEPARVVSEAGATPASFADSTHYAESRSDAELESRSI